MQDDYFYDLQNYINETKPREDLFLIDISK